MESIHFADLKSQYFNLKAEIDAAIKRCLENGVFINGPVVKAFSDSLSKYLGVKHVIPCANGTDALQIALMALELNPGDEVIVPAFGYVSPLEALVLLQLKPVFIDVDPDTFLLDENQLESVITSKTKAIIPIQLFGQNADMETILAIAEKNGLYVIEDAAQSLGSIGILHGKNQQSGTMGHIGCTSFFPTKNLGCFGDGGAVFTNDDLLAEKIRSFASHGQSQKYIYERVGINSRLDAVQAAILSVKLPYLDNYNARRREIADFYNAEFENIDEIKTPVRTSVSTHIFHQYIIKLRSNEVRDNLQKALSADNIATAIYYPLPLHLQKAYSRFNDPLSEFPVSEDICKTTLALPVYSELSNEQTAYIAETVFNFFNK